MISKTKIKLRVTHSDQCGGFNSIGGITITTGIIASEFSLITPLFIQLIENITFGMIKPIMNVILISVFVVTYLLIALNYIIPSLSIYRIINQGKSDLIQEIGKAYEDSFDNYKRSRQNISLYGSITMYHWINLQNDYLIEIQKIRPFPFSHELLAKIICVAFIPIVTTIVILFYS